MHHIVCRFLGARLFICIFALLSGCVSMPDSRNLSISTNPLHGSKDVVMTFPAWYSDADKYKALNVSAALKAKQKCQDTPYQLMDVFSEPWSGMRINIISANIVCRPTEKPVVIEPILTTTKQVQKQKSITMATPETPVTSKESDQKKKCLRMGLTAGSDDYNLCQKSRIY